MRYSNTRLSLIILIIISSLQHVQTQSTISVKPSLSLSLVNTVDNVKSTTSIPTPSLSTSSLSTSSKTTVSTSTPTLPPTASTFVTTKPTTTSGSVLPVETTLATPVEIQPTTTTIPINEDNSVVTTTTGPTTAVPTKTVSTKTTPKPVIKITTTVKTPIPASFRYEVSANDTSYCNGNGLVLEVIGDNNKKVCSCFEDYHGLQCQHKVDKIMEKIVFGLAIFAGILLIILIFVTWQWHTRLGDIVEKTQEVKELSREKDQYRKQNKVLKQRTPSPNRSQYAASQYAASQYAGSQYASSVVSGHPNAGFGYEDDRHSVYSYNMPVYDHMAIKEETAEDVTINMESDGDLSGDELDGNKRTQQQLDAMSIDSINSADSHRVLLRPKSRQYQKRNSWAADDQSPYNSDSESPAMPERKPRSSSHGNITDVQIDSRGYIVHPDTQRRLTPSPKPNELSIENIRDFDARTGEYREPHGRAKSLMDLRVIALTGDKHSLAVSNNQQTKARSIENISTGQVYKLGVRPNGVNADKAKGKGIWARTQHREMQDSIATSAF